MAVYTKISSVELARHLTNYEIGELISLQEILDGIDNSNFILITSKGKFIFTIFEGRIDKASLPFFINLKLHLSQKKIPCPNPIISKSGEVILDFCGKKSAIVSFLVGKTLAADASGYYPAISKEICRQIGKLTAQLHLAADGFALNRSNELGVLGFAPLFAKFSDKTDLFLPNLASEIGEMIAWLEKFWREDLPQNLLSNLPSKACHLDLFADNVFFDEKFDFCGVIDFYFSADELLIYDFAIAVNAWCFTPEIVFREEKQEVIPKFSEEKFAAMLAGYESVRQLLPQEKEFLSIALIAASMRFLLTRLHDYFFTSKDSLVKIKDPLEYLHKLRFFQSFLKVSTIRFSKKFS